VIKEFEPTKVQEPQGFLGTQEFLKTAIAEGADIKKPKMISESVWRRNIDITWLYCETDKTQEEIKEMFTLSRERVRQIIDITTQRLWNNSSLQTQALFPLEQLVLRKPLSVKSKERHSLVRGGLSVFIRNELDAGKSIEQIRGEAGLSMESIGDSRRVLKGWGRHVPYFIHNTHPQTIELEKKLINAKTDEEKQELLNQITRSFYDKHAKGESPLLVSVKTAITEVGFRPSLTGIVNFVKSLQSKSFPVRELKRLVKGTFITSYFFLMQDKQKAQGLWFNDENLQKFYRP